MLSSKSFVFFLLASGILFAMVPESSALFDFIRNLFREDCNTIKCARRQRLVRNPNYTLVQNGCEDFAQFNFSDKYEGSAKNWSTCCEDLTGCYQTCGSSKRSCDNKFRSCVEKVASKNPRPTSETETVATSTVAKDASSSEEVGLTKSERKALRESLDMLSKITCTVYENYQSQACVCK